MLQKISVSNKCCYYELLFIYFYSFKNPEKMYHGFQNNIRQKKTVFNIDNNKKRFLSSKSA